MRSIDITRAHALTHTQALELGQAIADDIAEQYGASYEWVGDVLRFERAGIKGAIHILPKQVHLRAQLGFLMAPLRGMIEAHINRFLDEHAGSKDPGKTRDAVRKMAGQTPTAKGGAATKAKASKVAGPKTTKAAARKVVKKPVGRATKK